MSNSRCFYLHVPGRKRLFSGIVFRVRNATPHTVSPHERRICQTQRPAGLFACIQSRHTVATCAGKLNPSKEIARYPFSRSLSLRQNKNLFRLYLCCNVSNCIFVPIKVCIFPIFLRFLSSKSQKLYSTQVRC